MNWTYLDASAMDSGTVAAVAVSTEPVGRLYFGGTNFGRLADHYDCLGIVGLEFQQDVADGTVGFWALLPDDKVKYIGPWDLPIKAMKTEARNRSAVAEDAFLWTFPSDGVAPAAYCPHVRLLTLSPRGAMVNKW